MQASGELTELLARSASGDEAAIHRIYDLVYQELRIMARRQLAVEGHRLTLDTTALVHEAYLKLINYKQVTAHDRAFFFGAAARAMRQVLVDAARRRARTKRGGGRVRVTLDDTTLSVDEFATDVMALDECLERLSGIAERQARVVEYRFFGGMDVNEIAAALKLSRRTVLRDWTLARAWLVREMSGTDDDQSGSATD